MREKKRCNTITRDDIVDSWEINYGSEFRNKSSSLNQGENEEVADELSDNSYYFIKYKRHLFNCLICCFIYFSAFK